ncbi:MAG: AbrB/MazE/SpoVT family DNA-binding domain-containing protein [Clostridia bacterium]|nr:AbrB/MazE/SpoVT family DNA-binding domain-containing protein [Clostridia bacterium]
MKSTGVTRQIDELGRFVLPIEIRRAMGLKVKDTLEIFTDDDGRIILQKYQPACIFCDHADDIVLFEGKRICSKCMEKIKAI